MKKVRKNRLLTILFVSENNKRLNKYLKVVKDFTTMFFDTISVSNVQMFCTPEHATTKMFLGISWDIVVFPTQMADVKAAAKKLGKDQPVLIEVMPRPCGPADYDSAAINGWHENVLTVHEWTSFGEFARLLDEWVGMYQQAFEKMVVCQPSCQIQEVA